MSRWKLRSFSTYTTHGVHSHYLLHSGMGNKVKVFFSNELSFLAFAFVLQGVVFSLTVSLC